MWIKLGNNIIGALYHFPKPNYQSENLLLYLEASLEEISRAFPAATVILCGDFNQLSDDIVCERTGLTSIVKQPTRVSASWIASTFHSRVIVSSES